MQVARPLVAHRGLGAHLPVVGPDRDGAPGRVRQQEELLGISEKYSNLRLQ